MQATVPHLTRLLDGKPDLDQIYDKIASVDFSKSVLTRVPERLVVMRDAASGWTDLGSPRRVVDVLSQHIGESPLLTGQLAALRVQA